MPQTHPETVESWWKSLPVKDQEYLRAHRKEPLPAHLAESLVQAGFMLRMAYWVGQGAPSGFPLPPEVREYLDKLDENEG